MIRWTAIAALAAALSGVGWLGLGARLASGDTDPAGRRAKEIAVAFFRSQNERRYDQTCRLFARGFYEKHRLRDQPTCEAVLHVGLTWSGRIDFTIGTARRLGDRFVVPAMADGTPGRIVLVREGNDLRILAVEGGLTTNRKLRTSYRSAQGKESPLSSSAYPGIGSELFGYRLEALLGRGGMSVVYRAHDLALERKVALKLLAPELTGDEGFRSRFLRESRVAASLDHPNVIPIYEAGEADGLLCIAMRYVEGTDLKILLRREGALGPERALSYCAQVAAALDAAHGRGLVHRDVKPSNVLITHDGHCYLADFGLTHDAADRSDLTRSGQFIGSVDYAAPEQIEGKPVDGSVDVYSLGCVLYECLTGSVPFPKQSELAVLWAHVNDPPPRLDSSPGLSAVVRRALAKRPAERYPTCGALVDAARAALPRADSARERSPRRLIGIATLVSVLLAGGLAAGLTWRSPADRARRSRT